MWIVPPAATSAVQLVADLLLNGPVINAQLLQGELGISTGNARRYVDPLTDAGIIAEFTDRTPQPCLARPRVLGALDAFAERAGRRGLSRDPSCGSAGVLCGFRHLSENHGPTRQ